MLDLNKYLAALVEGKVDKADQFLFDLGYSYGLLRRAEALLLRTSPGDDSIELEEFLSDLKKFQESRLASIEEIYAASPAAMKKINLERG